MSENNQRMSFSERVEWVREKSKEIGDLIVEIAGSVPRFLMRLSSAIVSPFISTDKIGLLISIVFSLVLYSVFFMFDALFRDTLKVDPTLSWLSGVMCIGTMVIMLIVVSKSDNNALKGATVIQIPIYIVIINLIVAAYIASNAKIVTVGDEIIVLGRAIAGFFMGINIVPAITMLIAYNSKKKFNTMTDAAGAYFAVVVKTVVIAASGAANVYYGIHLKIPAYVAFLCGFLLEACFVWASIKMANEASKSDGEKDIFDLILWTVSQLVVVVLLCLVAVQTVSELSGLTNTWIAKNISFGAEIYLSIVAVVLIMIAATQTLTAWVNWRPSEGLTIKRPDVKGAINSAKNAASKIGNGISNSIGGMAGGFRDGFGGNKQQAQLNKSAPAPKAVDEDDEDDEDDDEMASRILRGTGSPK